MVGLFDASPIERRSGGVMPPEFVSGRLKSGIPPVREPQPLIHRAIKPLIGLTSKA
jgi:hypothetical protein